LAKELRYDDEARRSLERGVNALWTDGGLMYAPPYR